MNEVTAKTGTHSIFKGTGAAKFSMIPPRRDNRGFVTKNGAILLEAAPAEGKRPNGLPNYDWSKKITFAIGVQDITSMVDPKTNKLIHQTTNGSQDITKTLQFAPGEGRHSGTYQMYLNTFAGNEKAGVFVPLSQGEFLILQKLLVTAIPQLIGWT
jgi:hypothetical protein